jgi:hypothetical protein
LSRILKIILFAVLLVVFFEAGLISSYTIVTSQPPDVAKLIDMQLSELSSLFNLGTSGNSNNQQTLKILNPDDVGEAIKNRTNLDGINLQTLSATTSQSTDQQTITLNITVMGYKEVQSGGNSTSGQIVIKTNETYSITALASGKLKTGGVTVDVNTIQILSTLKLYA